MAATVKDLAAYAIPVRRSVIRRDLWLGIPLIPLVLLLFATVVMVLTFGQIAFLAVTAVVYFILRQITKKDEYLLEIILFSLLQPDDLR